MKIKDLKNILKTTFQSGMKIMNYAPHQQILISL